MPDQQSHPVACFVSETAANNYAIDLNKRSISNNYTNEDERDMFYMDYRWWVVGMRRALR